MARYRGTTGNDQIVGAAEANYFYDVGTGHDVLTGGGKSDIFYLTVDDIVDYVDGRDGNDTIDYSRADRAVRIDLISGSVTATFHDQQHLVPYTVTVTQVQNIENATGSIYGDTIYGTDGNNTLDGNAGDDYLYGRDGKDTLLGGDGADHLYGGDQDDTLIGGIGNDYINGGAGLGDTVSYADVDRGVGVEVDFRDQASSQFPYQVRFYGGAGAETDTVVNVENAIGTKYGDHFEGGVEANVFDGADGNDFIWGFGGADTLKGGAGDDHLNGGRDADSLIGGDGSDWAEYDGSTAASDQPYGNVIISLVDPANNTWEAKGDSYDSIENIVGSPFNDIITGNDGDNIIIDNDDGTYRPDGYNYFYGLDGRDTFIGSPYHPDYFYGGNDEDTVDYSGLIPGSVTIDLEHQALNDMYALGDRFYFVENIVGTNMGDDTIYGDFANNTFNGGGHDDRLMGRGGDDTLIGGSGTDTAVFSGNFADYTFRTLHFNDGERFLEVHDTHADRDGTDYVIEVEHLEFHNITVNTSDLMLLI